MDCAIAYSVAYFIAVMNSGEVPFAVPHFKQAPMRICEMRRSDRQYKKSGWLQRIDTNKRIQLRVWRCVPCIKSYAARSALAEHLKKIAARVQKQLRDRSDATYLETSDRFKGFPRWPNMGDYNSEHIQVAVSQSFFDDLQKIRRPQPSDVDLVRQLGKQEHILAEKIRALKETSQQP